MALRSAHARTGPPSKLEGNFRYNRFEARTILRADPHPDPSTRMNDSDAAIVVVDLCKTYGAVEAVKGISFAVRRGTTTALLGGNGAGKTTTLSMLLGVLTPTAGSVAVLGEEMPRQRARILPRINFTSPYVDLPKRLTVRENLSVFADLYGVRNARARIAAVAADFDLGEFLRRPYGTLSAGQRTRVSLAKAVINEPEVLLLDEPTASLDPDVGDRMRTYLEQYQRRTGCTMLLASHHMGEVERMCDDVIMLRAGRVVDQGSPAALLARYGRDNMEEVFLDIARGRGDDERMAGGGADEVASL
jgi:ABC-2 type transport system ATP-binding protein